MNIILLGTVGLLVVGLIVAIIMIMNTSSKLTTLSSQADMNGVINVETSLQAIDKTPRPKYFKNRFPAGGSIRHVVSVGSGWQTVLTIVPVPVSSAVRVSQIVESHVYLDKFPDRLVRYSLSDELWGEWRSSV